MNEANSCSFSLKSYFDNATNGIFRTDLDGNILEVNTAFATALVFSEPQELIDQKINLINLFLENDTTLRSFFHNTDFEGVVDYESEMICNDGRVIDVSLSMQPQKCIGRRTPVLEGMIRDITKRKQEERKLKASERVYRNLVNSVRCIIVHMDKAGNVVFMNKYGLDFFGYTREELIGNNVLKTIVPESPQLGESLRHTITQILESPETYHENENENICKDGSHVWISWTNEAYLTESGQWGVLSIGIDRTAAKQAEIGLENLNKELEERVKERTHELENSLEQLQNTQNQLVESEKLAALGGLMAGLAHEINTPLGSGLTSITYLHEQLSDFEMAYKNNELGKRKLEKFIFTSHELLNAATMNLSQTGELIQSFKLVAADQACEERRAFHLKDYLEDISNSLRPSLRKGGHRIELLGDESIIESYPATFMQIISNLVTNSVMHGFHDIMNGHIVITVYPPDDQHADVVIKYNDNGRGMSEEEQHRCFDPFYTTGREYGGTGLGMHIVYNLVNQMLGGIITIESRLGQGTTFTLRFPAKSPEQNNCIPKDL
ncbi:MAG: PAS domain S-box protein [Desulfovibrio sp.]